MSMGKLEDGQHKTKEQQRRKRQQQLRKLQKHHQHTILSKNCAFNVLISDDTTNGYESDSSYIVRRREPSKLNPPKFTRSLKTPSRMPQTGSRSSSGSTNPVRSSSVPAPVSRSVYSSIQRGEDIPFQGLRRPLYPRDKESNFRKPLSNSRDNVQAEQVIY